MPYGNNDLNADELFEARSIYAELYDSENPEYLDFRGKRLFFGKVDCEFNAVMVKESELETFDQKVEASALRFVVDAFAAMKRYISLCQARGILQLESTDFLQDMQVRRGWVDLNKEYAEALKNQNFVFLEQYVTRHGLDKKIANVNDYIRYFMEFYKLSGGALPITRTNFILTNLVSPNVSGLCLEIATLNHSEDGPKVEEFFSNRYFSYYVTTARRFGFLVDKNAPWRLVANFGSPQMQRYMRPYGLTRENIFERCYVQAYPYDMETLRRYMIYYYNTFATESPVSIKSESVVCGGRPVIKTKQVRRQVLRYDAIFSSRLESSWMLGRYFYLTDDYWLPQYYTLRAIEAGQHPDKYKIQRETKKVIKLKNYIDLAEAMLYINEETKTTFRDGWGEPPPEGVDDDLSGCG